MSAPLEVLVDATALSGVASGSGIGSYVRGLLGALGARPGVRASALCERGCDLPAGVAPLEVRRLARRLAPGRARAEVVEHSLRLPVEVALRRGPAVFHNPAYHAPGCVRAPWVQTLLDVIPLVYDAEDQAALRERWRRFGPRYRRAGAVLAISRHAAEEGVRVLGLDRRRVLVAPLGVDPRYSPGEPPPAAGRSGGRPYVLVVSEYSARKGFGEAFEVAARLADAGYPHRLLVAGRVHPWASAELRRLVASSAHPERVEILGYVEDLVGLYRGADCFVTTSRYEGFGLPALEAMACGTPVVAFANSAVTEVVEGGGRLVPDGDVAAMTAAVRQLLDCERLRAEWSERGTRRAAGFTWEASAEVHEQAYRAAAERRPAGGT